MPKYRGSGDLVLLCQTRPFLAAGTQRTHQLPGSGVLSEVDRPPWQMRSRSKGVERGLNRRPRKFLELNPGNDYTAIGEFYWTKISVVRLWLGVTVAGMVMPELTNRTSPHIGRGTIMLQLAAVKTCNQTLSKLAIGRTKKLRLADE